MSADVNRSVAKADVAPTTGVQRAPLSISVQCEIPFHDVDVMQVCWHGHYLKYFELGRTALLRRFDYDYPEMQASGYHWPIVEVYVKYVRPAVYGQKIEIRATLLEFENRLKIAYAIVDVASATRLTKGYTTQVAVEVGTQSLQFVSPQVVLDKVRRVCGA